MRLFERLTDLVPFQPLPPVQDYFGRRLNRVPEPNCGANFGCDLPVIDRNQSVPVRNGQRVIEPPNQPPSKSAYERMVQITFAPTFKGPLAVVHEQSLEA